MLRKLKKEAKKRWIATALNPPSGYRSLMEKRKDLRVYIVPSDVESPNLIDRTLTTPFDCGGCPYYGSKLL